MSNNLLNKKTTRDKFSISKQMTQSGNEEQLDKGIGKARFAKNNFISIDLNYAKEYKKYILNGYTRQSYDLITKILNCTSAFSSEVKSKNKLHPLMIKTIKQLLMNELEIVYYSLYLDHYPYIENSLELFEHLLVVGLLVKKYFNRDTKSIENFLNAEYWNLIERYNKRTQDRKMQLTIDPIAFNDRFNLLKAPCNPNCNNNFVDYNDSIDQILQISLPYNERNKSRDSKKVGYDEHYYSVGNSDNKNEQGYNNIFKVFKPKISLRVIKPMDKGNNENGNSNSRNLIVNNDTNSNEHKVIKAIIANSKSNIIISNYNNTVYANSSIIKKKNPNELDYFDNIKEEMLNFPIKNQNDSFGINSKPYTFNCLSAKENEFSSYKKKYHFDTDVNAEAQLQNKQEIDEKLRILGQNHYNNLKIYTNESLTNSEVTISELK